MNKKIAKGQMDVCPAEGRGESRRDMYGRDLDRFTEASLFSIKKTKLAATDVKKCISLPLATSHEQSRHEAQCC